MQRWDVDSGVDINRRLCLQRQFLQEPEQVMRDVRKRRHVASGHDINRRLRLRCWLLHECSGQRVYHVRSSSRDVSRGLDINRRLRMHRGWLLERHCEQRMQELRCG